MRERLPTGAAGGSGRAPGQGGDDHGNDMEGFASVHAPVAFGEGKEQTFSETCDAQFAAGGGSRAIDDGEQN